MNEILFKSFVNYLTNNSRSFFFSFSSSASLVTDTLAKVFEPSPSSLTAVSLADFNSPLAAFFLKRKKFEIDRKFIFFTFHSLPQLFHQFL